ncbi:MAG: PRC-barrel domain-containing protein [Anaerolineales bacterium]|nr:PRC-barrel domain-containing protein [Anaerolineales bacterium]
MMETNIKPVLLSAGTLNGTTVKNMINEDLGKIEELMINLSTGQVSFAVLSFGGFLGVGDKLFAIPWEALHFDTENEIVRVDIDKQKLENNTGFDKDHWPKTGEHLWMVNGAPLDYRPNWRR